MDPQAAGRELQVADVLTGHFQKEGDQLRVTLEVIDTASNRLLWRDTSSAAGERPDRLCASRSRRACARACFRCSGPRAGAAAGRDPAQERGGLRSLSAQQAALRAIAEPNRPGHRHARALRRPRPRLRARVGGLVPALLLPGGVWAEFRAPSAAASARTISTPAPDRPRRRRSPSIPTSSKPSRTPSSTRPKAATSRRPTEEPGSSSRRRPQDSQARFALAYVLRYAGLLEEAGTGMRRRPGAGSAQPGVPFLRLRLPAGRKVRPSAGVSASGRRVGMGERPRGQHRPPRGQDRGRGRHLRRHGVRAARATHA